MGARMASVAVPMREASTANKVAVMAGVVVTAAVVWSRLFLGRHVAADVATGLLLGTVAGVAYQLWVASYNREVRCAFRVDL